MAAAPTTPVPAGYAPWPHQRPVFEAIEERGLKRAMLWWHRRGGKDRTGLALTIRAMVRHPGNFFYVAPTFAQNNKIIWQGRSAEGQRFLEMFTPELVAQKNETDQSITFKTKYGGSFFQLLGSDNWERLLGVEFNGVVFTEFSRQAREIWPALRPVLAANKQAFALFISTPNGMNHAFTLSEAIKDDPAWFWDLRTVRDTARADGTPIIDDAEVAQSRKEGMTEEEIQRDYFCNFTTAVEGAVYAEALSKAYAEGRIADHHTWDPARPCYAAWDLGYLNTRVWVFQRSVEWDTWRWVHFLPEVGDSGARGRSFEEWLTVVHKLPHHIVAHILPHDFRQHSWTSGESSEDVTRRRGLVIDPAPKVSAEYPLIRMIEQGRRVLNRSTFDARTCAPGLNDLSNHAVADVEGDAVPRHDKYSHGADAFRTAVTGFVNRDEARRRPAGRAKTDFSVFGYHDELAGRE